MNLEVTESIRILLVDDDADDREGFADALRKLDLPHILYEADSCKSMMELLDTQPLPQIIFMDINMPLPNGLECLKKLKEHPVFKLLPVVMYSVSNRKEDIDTAYGDQAHHYIIKPFVAANLPPTLRKIFEHNWHSPLPQPSRDGFVIDISYML